MTQQLLFQRELLIDAPLTHVWQLVGTEEGLRQWWGNTIYLEAKEGGRCEEWRPRHGVSTHWRGIVTLYAPPHELMLTLRAQEAQQDGPEFTTIAIALSAADDKTRVHVTQRAFGPTQVIATQEQIGRETQPQWQQDLPLAQLQQPAPGSLPMPTVAIMPVIGSIDPAYHSTAQAYLGALTQTWQIRLSTLAALQSN